MSAPLARDHSSLRVLVVDDDPDQRMLVVRLLNESGIHLIAEAADGDSALAAAEDHDPDLVILDLVMPGRSGYDVLPDLQARVPEARIVVLSNLPRRPLEDSLRRRGAVGFVEKRVAPDQLVADILMTAALTDIALERTSIQLTADPSAARAARRFIREALEALDADLLSSVELLVSELVTNAVVHASTAPTMEVRLGPRTLRIEVHDDDPTMPAPRVPDPERAGGRGLQLVDVIATRWGADAEGDGKVVWFELARSAPGS